MKLHDWKIFAGGALFFFTAACAKIDKKSVANTFTSSSSSTTIGRITSDQVNVIHQTILAESSSPPASSGVLFSQRDEILAFGGLPFPSSERIPKYQPNLSVALLPGQALQRGFCTTLNQNLATTTASKENIQRLFLYLTGLDVDAARSSLLEQIGNTAPRSFSAMDLVCVAILGDDAFITY